MDLFFEHPGFEVRLLLLARFICAVEGHQHGTHTAGRPIPTYVRKCTHTDTETPRLLLYSRMPRCRRAATHLEVRGQMERDKDELSMHARWIQPQPATRPPATRARTPRCPERPQARAPNRP